MGAKHESENVVNYDTEAMAQALYEEDLRPLPWDKVPPNGKANWVARAGMLIQRYITTCERRSSPPKHECGGQMPNDHAAYCSTGQIAALQDENARLREALDRVAATAKHHRETANEEALRQENDPDMPSMIRDKLSGKITVRRLVAESLEGVLASLSEGQGSGT